MAKINNVGNFLIRFFNDLECTSQLGFQIANELTDKRIRANIEATVGSWLDEGLVQDDEVLVCYMKVGHVKETTAAPVASFTRADGTVVEAPIAEDTPSADKLAY